MIRRSITLLAGMIIGGFIGWYAGYMQPASQANRDARRYLASMEYDDAIAAIYALRAIPMIQAGETNRAIDWLARPLGSYYRVYGRRTGTNEQRIKLRAKIEQLATTNAAVAAELKREISGLPATSDQ